jgi:manganese transport protein
MIFATGLREDPMRLADGNSEPVADPGPAGAVSLEGLHGTVPVPPASAGFWRQWRAFAGPAFLVSVGYMDPGNWGTDLEAGVKFRYGLLWVVALSSLMAIVLQVLAARLGVVTGRDLAQACREFYPRWTRYPNWLACEAAIAACDLAEVLGSAVALKMLFHIPLIWAVIITAFDVLLLLALQGLGMRLIEAVVLALVLTIAACFFIELFVLPPTRPDFAEMGRALIRPSLGQEGMIVAAIGIIGATVMPHNLYLHSALVQSRRHEHDAARAPAFEGGPARAIRFNTIDTVVALAAAFLVNAAILVLAAVVFHGHEAVTLSDGRVVKFVAEPNGSDPDWIQVAYLTLAPLLGMAAASTLFAVALLASGQSSTITGTLAGQVVMEGFLHWRIRPWVRRLMTRLMAILPAVFVIGVRGDGSVTELLVLSQVVLAMQLPLAMFPLLHFTSSRQWMGRFASGPLLLAAGWTSAVLITVLDLYGLPDALGRAWTAISGSG